jgi:hypothetical protein
MNPYNLILISNSLLLYLLVHSGASMILITKRKKKFRNMYKRYIDKYRVNDARAYKKISFYIYSKKRNKKRVKK